MQLAGTGGIWPRPVCVWTPCGVPCSEELCLGNRPLQSLAAQAQHSQVGTQHTYVSPRKGPASAQEGGWWQLKSWGPWTECRLSGHSGPRSFHQSVTLMSLFPQEVTGLPWGPQASLRPGHRRAIRMRGT